MTGRERVTRILHRQPVDRLSWTTLVDDRTFSAMPPAYQQMYPLDFYQEIGCDVVQFGNYGLAGGPHVIAPSRLLMPEVQTEVEQQPDGAQVTTTTTPWGVLTSATKDSHPVRYAVTTPDDLRVFREMWLHSHTEEADGMEDSYARTERAIGDAGIYLPTVRPSPVQQLLQLDMGLANFYYLLQDMTTELEELMAVMHQRQMEACEILARRTPAIAVIAVENTSTTMISPQLYRRYSLPQVREFVEVMHGHGKLAVLHMCGLLKDLLPLIQETGADAINALTEPPLGDTHVHDVLGLYGEDFVICGTIFKSEVFQADTVSREQIWEALDAWYTPRLRQANMVMWLPADGLPTELDRFLAVSEWMEQNGAL